MRQTDVVAEFVLPMGNQTQTAVLLGYLIAPQHEHISCALSLADVEEVHVMKKKQSMISMTPSINKPICIEYHGGRG